MQARIRYFILLIGISARSNSRAAVIDFDAFSIGSSNFDIAAPYEEDGFVLDIDSTISTVRSTAFGIFGTSDPGYTATKAAFLAWQGPIMSLARTDGTPFDLISIDIWEWRNQPIFVGTHHADVTFTGHVVGGSTVQKMISANGVWDSETFTYPTFRNLLSVEWDVKNGLSALHQFDNIVAVAVPEPPCWLLFALACVMIAPFCAARRTVASSSAPGAASAQRPKTIERVSCAATGS